tara:strand:- start:291 stop:518 length:228 start_codon:yes stop_codon:yes gene_type:complete
MTHYSKKEVGVVRLHGEGIGVSARELKNPIARSIKTRQQWQTALAQLDITSQHRENLNCLFEEMAMCSYDMGKQS